MAKDVNKIRNPTFTHGKKTPTGWLWWASHEHLRGSRELEGEPVGGVAITSDRPAGSGWWSQVVTCKPDTWYRIEAQVRCDLTIEREQLPLAGEAAGLRLSVQPVADGKPRGQRRITPALHRSSSPVTIRTYYETAADVRRLRIAVGLQEATGTAVIEEVRFIQIIEPEEASHVMAIPPPAHAVPAPRVAGSVCIGSDTAEDRPLTRRLRAYFGQANVQALPRRGLNRKDIRADAVILPDREPPAFIRSWRSLVNLADRHIVVISLPALARLAPSHVSLRRIEQPDDPIHAKVTYANHATRAFALDDVFPYAWSGRRPGSFVQHQFRRTGALEAFFKRNELVTLLESMCDQDATSERPIALYKETPGGGLFVLDVDPVEADASTMGEPTLAMHLLLSVLGRQLHGLGQYTVPENTEAELRNNLRDMDVRFAPLMVHDSGLPAEEVTEQLVTVGGSDASYGLPLKPKPLILVRTGLEGGDVESVHGALLWFKQLVRMVPHTCPYAQPLSGRFRFAWIPCAAQWQWEHGWLRDRSAPNADTEIELDGAELAAVIDVISRPINRARVVLPANGRQYDRYRRWLPSLFEAFTPGRHFACTVDESAPFNDRDAFDWRFVRHRLNVAVAPDHFTDQVCRQALAAGGEAIRLEVPGFDADVGAQSIWRTDLCATALEQVIGMQYGLIAVNRDAAPVQFNGFPPVAPGQALILDRAELMRQSATQAG